MVETDKYQTRGICSVERYGKYLSTEKKDIEVSLSIIGQEGDTIELVMGVYYTIPTGRVAYEITASKRESIKLFDQRVDEV